MEGRMWGQVEKKEKKADGEGSDLSPATILKVQARNLGEGKEESVARARGKKLVQC